MAVPGMGAAPYWELSFDADGDVDGGQRDRLLREAPERGVKDLIVFAHGRYDDPSGADRFQNRFLGLFPGLAPHARLGYAGVVWPSMRFMDEALPGAGPAAAQAGPALDKGTLGALLDVFPGRATLIDQLSRMLDRQPAEEAALAEFGRLVRLLVALRPEAPQAAFAADTRAEEHPGDEPAMLVGDPVPTCRALTPARQRPIGANGAAADPVGFPEVWHGAHELLRQAAYFAMKRRAGAVGERGLGRVVGRLARSAPGLRVHLVGHGAGGRLVSFALRGLPRGVRTVKSVTLLQAAFSHYAFAPRLPHDARDGGVLSGFQNRIDGPLVCCYSRHDTALGTFYPPASRRAGGTRPAADPGRPGPPEDRWGALGHDGILAVPGTRAFGHAEALRTPLPVSGCVSVDASAVVREGGPPAGAHHDVCRPELARVVLAAGRIR
ncbi:serine-threonine protein kinase [Streptomyces fructofermentans]|uniref:serine-threonine protein kinase n=1 Tax=Streptomyces fructofermentans TaxID=152141 RepID=UPI0033FECD56